MKEIGFVIINVNDGSTLVTTKSSNPSRKLYTSRARAEAALNTKIKPILRIMEKYPLQRHKYEQRLLEWQQYKVVPAHIFESDL